MGRTLPTFRRVIDEEERRWNDLRRGLGPEAQRAFDAVFQRARRHASAAGNQGVVEPMWAIMLTVLIENEMELQRLLARVAWLESELERRPHSETFYAPVVEDEGWAP
ncbi:MAG: hypothetical protein KY455_04470 [Euryarchaeota archaeon]|nr:hypothetical protein [Euryarchaeota archaeon]